MATRRNFRQLQKIKDMKAQELRIGNFIENTDSQMASYMVVNADVIKQNELKMYASLEPIPLTEEWLLKFGFSQMTDTSPFNYRTHKSKMFFYIRYGTFTTDGGKTDLSGYNGLFIANKFVRVIRYVHELQNLYFALTGEELTLNQ